MGFGAEGKIPWSRIIQYAEFYELDKLTTKLLVNVITALDTVYLAWAAEEQQRKNKTTTVAPKKVK